MAVVLESMQLESYENAENSNDGLEDLHSAVDLGEIAVGHHLGWLVADTNLEASRAPIDE